MVKKRELALFGAVTMVCCDLGIQRFESDLGQLVELCISHYGSKWGGSR